MMSSNKMAKPGIAYDFSEGVFSVPDVNNKNIGSAYYIKDIEDSNSSDSNKKTSGAVNNEDKMIEIKCD